MTETGSDGASARSEKHETQTGGRPATKGVIPGRYALSVGNPDLPAPEGWHWTALADVARLESGHTPSRKHPEYWGGDIPWIGIRDATGNHGRTLMDTAQHTNELGLANSSARLLPADTVCLSRTASVGYVVVMGRPMATSQDFVNWICSDRLDFRFLQYVLLAEHETFLTFASGTTHQTIYFPEVKAFHVCLPPIDVQHRIVEVLSAYDELIENNTRRIQILEGMAQAIYREWFVEFRYPGHEDVPLVASDLGPIPERWEIRRVVDMATVDKGLSYKGAFLTDEGHPMANLKCFNPGGGFRRHGTKPYSGEFKARHAVRPGDLIVANTDLTQAGQVIGSPAIIPTRGFEDGGLISHHLFAVRTEDRRIEVGYLYYLLQDERFRSFARGRASGTTVLGFRSADFLSYEFPCAPPELQRRFGELVADMHLLSEGLEDSNENLRSTRDLLLPRLVSGEIDVSNLDIDVGDAAA